MSNKYFILKLLQLTIVAGVCCMALQVFLIVILDWSEITNLQLTGLTMGLIGMLNILYNSELWTLKIAALSSAGFVLSSLYLVSDKDVKFCISTLITGIVVIGAGTILAVLLKLAVAHLIKKENGR